MDILFLSTHTLYSETIFNQIHSNPSSKKYILISPKSKTLNIKNKSLNLIPKIIHPKDFASLAIHQSLSQNNICNNL
jgi:hypothetical protein